MRFLKRPVLKSQGDSPLTSAQLLLLSRFLNARSADSYYGSEGWTGALHDSPERTIPRLERMGLLRSATPVEHLDAKLKLTELKEMLRARGLKVSGRKAELAERLAEADPRAVTALVAGEKVLCCTEKGKALAEEYLRKQEQERAQLESLVADHVRAGQFGVAAMHVAEYEAKQVFPRGLNMDWANYDPKRDVRALHLITTSRPGILRRLAEELWPAVRLAASMMYLLGVNDARQWLDDSVVTGLPFDNSTIARMLLFHARHLQELEQFRQMGVGRVSVLAASDSCPTCKAIDGRVFPTSKAPELPCPACSHPLGCRCLLLAKL